ncbi:MAG: hypothetical protein DKM50_12670 [Candidatus Margulisiibacteriota bacterium]|nr:MAG: hypothetical protein A2X43_11130 [Candidatus Margulisbacteria bacterium GWD2_39_127]OGI02782.1 MAG: hypothetical protein A2X42_01955 [Candidatus Margulisbacteria bacterium GWF2_38_17]OGI09331.1 MAG: hypothetical protein A2X41_09420 [Candidatus Margulisbacteria bacterium GWE2_39_32]PZM77455.1 MAG: hypothetical protein DKM50_12670 [Candidatus Margulisiibacteriota bacterium]HAR63982.1 hypothetical protein [Candidatus Margulisiibacteriota bacterium]
MTIRTINRYRTIVLQAEFILIGILLIFFFLLNKTLIPGLLWGASFRIIIFNQTIKYLDQIEKGKVTKNVIIKLVVSKYIYLIMAFLIPFLFPRINVISMVIGLFSITIICVLKEFIEYYCLSK